MSKIYFLIGLFAVSIFSMAGIFTVNVMAMNSPAHHSVQIDHSNMRMISLNHKDQTKAGSCCASCSSGCNCCEGAECTCENCSCAGDSCASSCGLSASSRDFSFSVAHDETVPWQSLK